MGENRIIIDVVLLHYCVYIHLPATITTQVMMQGAKKLIQDQHSEPEKLRQSKNMHPGNFELNEGNGS
jgi:hypothetical protein